MVTTAWVTKAGEQAIALVAVILLSLVVCILIRYVQQLMYWRKKGIPGPLPLPIIGTLYLFMRGLAYRTEEQLVEKYGRLVGLIDSGTPVLLVSDPEVVKQLLVSRFSAFADNVPPFYDDIGRHSLTGSNGPEWKMLHRVISPMFSNARLQAIVPQILDCLQRLEQHIDRRISQSPDVDTEEVSLKFMADMTTRTFLSLDHDVYQEPESDLTRAVLGISQFAGWKSVFIMMFPTWFLNAINFNVFDSSSADFLIRALSHVLHQKRQQETIHKAEDFMQVLLTSGHKNPELALTDKQTVGNMLSLMIAGFLAPASLMQLVMRCLADQPEMQEKMRREILSRPPLDQDVHMHEDRSSLVDCCVNEVARLFPAATRIDRVCRKDCTVRLPDGKDLVIEATTGVRINVYTLSRDPDVYPNPESFDPERFLPGGANHETRIPTFGIGPRNWVGEKFARLALRLVVDFLLRRYRFSVHEKTPPLDFSHASVGFIAHKVQVYVQRL